MAQQRTVADRILKAVQHAPGCQLDHLAVSLLDLTWSQVFLEVDRMGRTGQIRDLSGRPESEHVQGAGWKGAPSQWS